MCKGLCFIFRMRRWSTQDTYFRPNCMQRAEGRKLNCSGSRREGRGGRRGAERQTRGYCGWGPSRARAWRAGLGEAVCPSSQQRWWLRTGRRSEQGGGVSGSHPTAGSPLRGTWQLPALVSSLIRREDLDQVVCVFPSLNLRMENIFLILFWEGIIHVKTYGEGVRGDGSQHAGS